MEQASAVDMIEHIAKDSSCTVVLITP